MAAMNIPTSFVVRGYGARLPDTGYYEMFVDNGTERGDMTGIAVSRTHADGSVDPLFIGTLEEMPIEGVEKGTTIRLDKAKEFPDFNLARIEMESELLSQDTEIKKLVNWYINLVEEMK